MLKKRQNHFMHRDSTPSKHCSFSSPKKRTFLSVVTKSKSKDKNNKTQSSIKIDLHPSADKSILKDPLLDL